MSVMTAFSEGRTRLRKKQREGGREMDSKGRAWRKRLEGLMERGPHAPAA